MAESFSVRAILSAVDRGFSAAMKQAVGAAGTVEKKMKGGLGFGFMAGVGQQAFSYLTQGAHDLVGEISASNAAWKTFEGNMKIIYGDSKKTAKKIEDVKGSMQTYAEETIYSSSDMASTYAQLAAVGVKSADKLVTGFGGLAAAAENPTQAMKTLSQQATQMAGKPTVAWADFKLMMEQTPAGIAAVAKEMGMSTSDLVKNIQAGEVETKDFFKAIEKVGNSKGFSDMAKEYKTVEQAMGGLQETLGNKLGPAFEVLSGKAIKGIEGIINKVGEIKAEDLADKVSGWVKQAEPYWEAFKGVLKTVGGVLKNIGKFLLEHSDTISKALPWVLGLVAGYKAFSFVSSVVPGMMQFTSAIAGLAGKGIGAIAGKLFGIAAAEKVAGTASQTSSTQVLAAAKAFMMMGAAVLMISGGLALLAYAAVSVASAGPAAIAVMFGLVASLAALGAGMAIVLKTLAPMSAQLMPVATAMLAMGAAVVLVATGFALMAQTAISLANAGGLAIGVMVGLVAAVALLAVGAAVLGPALTAGAVGMIAFGAAVALVGAGVLLASAGLALLAGQLPTIATHGMAAAAAVVALGAGLIVFAAGATLAGAAALVLGAGLVVASAGMIAAGASVLVVAAGLVVLSAGALAVAGALKLVQSSLKSIASQAKTAQTSIKNMQSSVKVIQGGLDALGGKAKAAMRKLASAFDTTASKAKSAGQKVGTGFANGMQSGLAAAATQAQSTSNRVTTALNQAVGTAKTAGQGAGKGFTNSLKSGLSGA